MARRRSFSSEFKRQISREFLEGRAGVHELARRYSLSRNLIRLWVRKYEAGEFTDELAEAVRIARLCAELPRYGYRRITAQLRTEGLDINHKAAARMMRERGLQARPLRRFVRTTDSEHDSPIFPNLARGFIATGADQLWVADIAIARGFVYLAVIRDAWSRRVAGYALGRQIDTRLTLAALRAAISARRPPPGLIHHSDRGPQYAAQPYRSELAAHGLVGSMGPARQPIRQWQGRELHEDAQMRGSLPQRLPDLR